MKLSTDQIQKLRDIEVDILKHFIDVCKKMDLKYYVIAGTLIGAVRHKGFIPWDDDIDVAMPRRDFDIFTKEAYKYLPKYLFVQTHFTDKEFPFNFAKIRNSNTTFIERSCHRLNINLGVFIDVFPLDHFLNDECFKKKTFKKIKIYKTAIGRVFFREHKSLKLRFNQFFSFFLFPNPYSALKAMDKFVTKIPKSDYCNNYSSNYGLKEACLWSWFGDGVDIEFEGIIVKAPKEYHLYLTQIYGDYMVLPPVEKRAPCHQTDLIDLNNSYITYLKGNR